MDYKVSVIIPTCKRPHFLSRAVDSVLAQTYKNVEAVVVDDNIADSAERNKTSEIMKKYRDDPRVIYVMNERPMGGGLSRNEGVKEARGEYITFLDDDDIYLPEKVETQLRFTLENELSMSFTDVYLHDNSGKLIEYRRHSYVADWSNDELMHQHILHSLGPTSTYMIKKSVLVEAGGFLDVPMGQDFMLMWRMIEFGTKIGYYPVSYIIQYLHDGERISVGKNKIDGENRLYELKKTKSHMLSKKEKKYVDFRHYAVLSVTSKRSGKFIDFIKYGVKAVLVSPSFFVSDAKTMLSNRFKADKKSSMQKGTTVKI